jgi:hypothetical protein
MSVGSMSPKGAKKRRTNAAKVRTRPRRRKSKEYDRMPPPPRGSMATKQPIQVAPMPPSGVVGESFELRIGESKEYRGDVYHLAKHPSHRETCLHVNRCVTPIVLDGDNLSLAIPRFVVFDVTHVRDEQDVVVGLRFVTTWTNPTWDAPRKSLAELLAERKLRQ